MGRQTQISKEDLLSAGVRIIIRSGYSALTVKTLAAEAGCSTQPILWSFGSMENYRAELQSFAFQYLKNKMNIPTSSAMMGFGYVGLAWLDTAIDEPNLLSYLFSTNLFANEDCGVNKVLLEKTDDAMAQAIAAQLGTEVQAVNSIMMTLKLFSLGMMNLLVGGSLKITKQQAHQLLHDVAITQMVGIGVKKEIVESFLNSGNVGGKE